MVSMMGSSKKDKTEAPDWWEEDAVREEIRAQLIKELTPKLRNEISQKVRVELEKEISAKLEKEIPLKLEKEFQSRLPTTDEQASASKMLSDLRTDCIVRAQTASEYCDALRTKRKISSTVNGTIITVALLIFAPTLYWLSSHGLTIEKAGWWAVIAPLFLSILIATIRWTGKSTELNNAWTLNQAAVVNYTTLATKIQASEIEVGRQSTITDLSNLVHRNLQSKESFDRNSHLSVKDLKRVRVAVVEERLTSTDPDEILRELREAESYGDAEERRSRV